MSTLCEQCQIRFFDRSGAKSAMARATGMIGKKYLSKGPNPRKINGICKAPKTRSGTGSALPPVMAANRPASAAPPSATQYAQDNPDRQIHEYWAVANFHLGDEWPTRAKNPVGIREDVVHIPAICHGAQHQLQNGRKPLLSANSGHEEQDGDGAQTGQMPHRKSLPEAELNAYPGRQVSGNIGPRLKPKVPGHAGQDRHTHQHPSRHLSS
jgi:hypothetical protein